MRHRVPRPAQSPTTTGDDNLPDTMANSIRVTRRAAVIGAAQAVVGSSLLHLDAARRGRRDGPASYVIWDAHGHLSPPGRNTPRSDRSRLGLRRPNEHPAPGCLHGLSLFVRSSARRTASPKRPSHRGGRTCPGTCPGVRLSQPQSAVHPSQSGRVKPLRARRTAGGRQALGRRAVPRSRASIR